MTLYWACAQTHPHQEQLSIRNLKRQGFHAFYPFFLVKNRYRRLSVRPVFPNYVFVEVDIAVPNWPPINNTLGVKRLLTQSVGADDYRRPAKISFVEDLLRLKIRHDGTPSAVEEALPAGTIVRIKRGPFAERTALVEMSAGDRVRLLLEAFNREVSIEFAVDDVVLVRRPTGALLEVRV